MTMTNIWIYHETAKPIVVKADEAQGYYDTGWADSPAKFIKYEALGINKEKIDAGDEEETEKAQQALDMVEGITDSLNGALNVDGMDKDELACYTEEHFGEKLDKRKSLKTLLKKAKRLIHGDSE